MMMMAAEALALLLAVSSANTALSSFDSGSETAIGVTLSKDGFFLQNGTHFYPIGLNYWPASTGCNLWTAETFPGAEIQHDLDVLAASPFNSLRIFLEWGALEPSEGTFDEGKFKNLALMLSWISQRRLLVDISTFVGWMSGRHYWPSWKRDRNMYTDATMINRSVAFAAKVAKTAAPFKSNLLAMEYGNEMNCCTDKAPPEAIIAWTHKIYAAFKMHAGASVLVVPGTDENTIIGSTGWPLGGVTGRIAGDILNFHPCKNKTDSVFHSHKSWAVILTNDVLGSHRSCFVLTYKRRRVFRHCDAGRSDLRRFVRACIWPIFHAGMGDSRNGWGTPAGRVLAQDPP